MTGQLAITDGLDRGAVVRLDKPGSVFHGYTAIVLGRGGFTAAGMARVQVVYPLIATEQRPFEPFAPIHLGDPIWFPLENVHRIEAS